MLLKNKLLYSSNSSAIVKLYSIARCDQNLSIIEIPIKNLLKKEKTKNY